MWVPLTFVIIWWVIKNIFIFPVLPLCSSTNLYKYPLSLPISKPSLVSTHHFTKIFAFIICWICFFSAMDSSSPFDSIIFGKFFSSISLFFLFHDVGIRSGDFTYEVRWNTLLLLLLLLKIFEKNLFDYQSFFWYLFDRLWNCVLII